MGAKWIGLLFLTVIINENMLIICKPSINKVFNRDPKKQQKTNFPIAVIGYDQKVNFFKTGQLILKKTNTIDIQWDTNQQNDERGLKVDLKIKGKGEDSSHYASSPLTDELSEMEYFNGHLTTVSRTTNKIYRFIPNTNDVEEWKDASDPFYNRCFNFEWAAVSRDTDGSEKLLLGTIGNQESTFDMVTINEDGIVKHEDSKKELYNRFVTLIPENKIYPTTHACTSNNKFDILYFLPKYVIPPEEDKKEKNINIILNYSLHKKTLWKGSTIQDHYPDSGYNSIKFLPYSKDDIMVGIQYSEEDKKTYITVFKLTGEIIYQPSAITETHEIMYSGFVFLSLEMPPETVNDNSEISNSLNYKNCLNFKPRSLLSLINSIFQK